MDDATATRAENLFQEIIKSHARLANQLADYHALVAGSPTTGQLSKQLFTTWATLWLARYREKYVFAGARDAGSFKRLLTTMTADQVVARMKAYLADDDAFLAKQRHPLALFISGINRYGGSGAVEAAPVGCRHDPPCRTEVEHTRRQMAERRGQS